ncbi:MAG: lytic transglycosylase domain-containing protein [Candidatus Deferrimicrobiaceae bacterium]
MRLFSKRRPESERRLGIVEELEMFARRARSLLFAVPVLLIAGLGVGCGVSHVLSLREGEPARLVEFEPHPQIGLSALAFRMASARSTGETTAEYIRMYQEQVAPVEQVLLRRGVPASTARKVAWPLVEQSYQNGVDPAIVLSVLIIESAGKPDARSSVGARGLMQIMPAWAGYWNGCGRDLYAIEDNLCNGTKILAWYLDRHRGNERRALLGYNGCVQGTVTPTCGQYPDKVAQMRRQVELELASARRKHPMRTAAALPADE